MCDFALVLLQIVKKSNEYYTKIGRKYLVNYEIELLDEAYQIRDPDE